MLIQLLSKYTGLFLKQLYKFDKFLQRHHFEQGGVNLWCRGNSILRFDNKLACLSYVNRRLYWLNFDMAAALRRRNADFGVIIFDQLGKWSILNFH